MKRITAIVTIVAALSLVLTGCKKSGSDQGGSDTRAKTTTGKNSPTDSVALKLKWPVGARYEQRLDLEQNSTIFVPRMPKPMKQETTMGQEFALTVLKERTGGGHEVVMEFLATQLMVTMGDRTLVNIDSQGESTGDDKNPMESMFRKLAGAQFTYLLDANNKVEKIEGVEEFRKTVLAEAPRQAQAIVNTLFSEDYFKQMMNYGQSLPADPVKVGDSWPVRTEVAMGPLGTMVMDLQYTLTGWEQRAGHNCAVLDFAGTLTTDPERGVGPLSMNLKIEDGKSSGKSWFAVESGMMVDTTINQSMKMLMAMPGRGNDTTNVAPTQTITNLMQQKIQVKLLPPKPARK